MVYLKMSHSLSSQCGETVKELDIIFQNSETNIRFHIEIEKNYIQKIMIVNFNNLVNNKRNKIKRHYPFTWTNKKQIVRCSIY